MPILQPLNFADITPATGLPWSSTCDATCGSPLQVVDDNSCALFHFKNDASFNFIQIDVYVIDYTGATTYYSTGMVGSSFADVILSVTPLGKGLFFVTTRGGLTFTVLVANFKLNNTIPLHINFGSQVTSPCQGIIVAPTLEGVWFIAFSSILVSAWHTSTGGGSDCYKVWQVLEGGQLFELVEGLSGPAGYFNALGSTSGNVKQLMTNGIFAAGSSTTNNAPVQSIVLEFFEGVTAPSCGFSPPVPSQAQIRSSATVLQPLTLNTSANMFGALIDSNVSGLYGVKLRNFSGFGINGPGLLAWSGNTQYSAPYAGTRAFDSGVRDATCVTNKYVFDTSQATSLEQSRVAVAVNTGFFAAPVIPYNNVQTGLYNFARPISIYGAFKA